MLIPDYNEVLNENINRFAFTAGVAKIAGIINNQVLEQLKEEAEAVKRGKTVDRSDEFQEILDEKPVTLAIEKLISGRNELVMPD
ncbi:MAG TPA: hypothetical protein GXZ23_06710 [Clostridiales bacterium]|jgi:hypothetical protein|nr:hypothetical protein [Clostridiales bacterium]